MIPRIYSCALILVLVSAPGFAQSSSKSATQSGTTAVAAATPVPAIPTDPNKLMLRAAEVNGLRGIQIPWHVKANYQTFDADGKPKDKGVFEEWWAGPNMYKISYASSRFHQVFYRNGERRLVTGDEGWVPLTETMIEPYLASPMPSEAEIEKKKFSVVDTKIGPVALTCLRPVAAPHTPLLPTICLNHGSDALRLQSNYGGLYIQFNNIVLADGHYVAKQINVENSNLPIVNMNVVALDFPPKMTDADVAAPASARCAPATASSPGLIAGRRTQYTFIRQPMDTRGDHGTVMLEATITTHGDVKDIEVISGPREFRDTAIASIRTWKFTPFTFNGHPVAFRIAINMKF